MSRENAKFSPSGDPLKPQQHTPGPWRIIHGPDEFIGIQRGPSGGFMVQGGNAEADARLIAAAPDLLAALKAMRDGAYGNPGYPEENDQIDAQADAAIAKAEG